MNFVVAEKKRKPISKKIRFEVFKRDMFTCQYCGGTPPKKVLEIDHIKPISDGGNNDLFNLLTSCFDCNRGKGSGLLTSVPDTLARRAEIVEEQERQLAEYNKVLNKRRAREDFIISKIEESFCEEHKSFSLKNHFKESIRENFIPYIDQHQLVAAMSKAVGICRDPEKAIKYFCGICWNLRRSAK